MKSQTRKMLEAVEGSKVDPIELARQRFARLEAAALAGEPPPPVDLDAARDEDDAGDAYYEDALVRLVQVARHHLGADWTGDDEQTSRAILEIGGALLNVQLARQRLRPGICAECGCTEERACDVGDTGGGGCAWVDESETLCTACAESDGTR